VKLGSLKADLVKEADGEWIDIPDLPGVALKVRSVNFPAYKTARDLAVQRLARKHGKKPIPEKEMAEVSGRLFAEHLLLGWRGFDVDYTPELALEVLTDPAYRELRAHVEWAAAQVGHAEVEFVEDLAKNSETASGTS